MVSNAIEGGRDTHSELSSATHGENWKVRYAGFARLAIKELLLSAVSHRTAPVKRVLHVLFHVLILAPAFSPHLQSPSMVFRLVVKPIRVRSYGHRLSMDSMQPVQLVPYDRAMAIVVSQATHLNQGVWLASLWLSHVSTPK